MKKILRSIATLSLVFLLSCGTSSELEKKVNYDTKNPENMLKVVALNSGGMAGLKAQNDVQFEYHYLKPDGKKDISIERYIFENEVSWAKYTTHEVNVSPEMEGDFVQYYDGKSATAFSKGEMLKDEKTVGMSQFLRQANYMWFTMMYKLTDPGTIHEYNGQEEIEGTTYDIVTVSYDPAVIGKQVNDTYVVYINPKTQLVEQFKFSLPALGVEAPVLLAKLTYKDINGLKIVTKRDMFAPAPDGSGMVPMVTQVLEDVKFNNGFTPENLSGEKM